MAKKSKKITCRVMSRFYDMKGGKEMKVGETFVCSKERFEEINSQSRSHRVESFLEVISIINE